MIEADIYGNVNSTHVMGSAHHERHRRLGRLCAQRLSVVLHDALDGQGWRHLLHRADGLARGPHRARRGDHRHRAGPGRPARPGSPTQRARLIIEKCAHPDLPPGRCCDYFERASRRRPASTRRTCWTRRCPGTRATSTGDMLPVTQGHRAVAGQSWKSACRAGTNGSRLARGARDGRHRRRPKLTTSILTFHCSGTARVVRFRRRHYARVQICARARRYVDSSDASSPQLYVEIRCGRR